MKRTLTAVTILLALMAAPAHAATTDFASSLAVAGDGSNDLVVAGSSGPDSSSSSLAFARVHADGAFDAASGGGDGRVVHNLGASAAANDIVSGPGTSSTFTGGLGNDILVGRVTRGLALDDTCAGNGSKVVDLGGDERGDLIVPHGNGYVIAGVRNGTGVVIKVNGDCTVDSSFGTRTLDFGAEGGVVAVNDILVNPATDDIVVAGELPTDAAVVTLQSNGDFKTAFSMDGLAKANLGTSADRFTGVTLAGGNLEVVGDDGSHAELATIDAGTGDLVSGPTEGDLGPGSDSVNGVVQQGANRVIYGSLPGAGIRDSAAVQIAPTGFPASWTTSVDMGAGGLDLLTDGASANGATFHSAIVDSTATQSFDFGLLALGPDGARLVSFNGGQFLVFDFTGQNSASGPAIAPQPPDAGGGSIPVPTLGADLETVDVDVGSLPEGEGVVSVKDYKSESFFAVTRPFYVATTLRNRGPLTASAVTVTIRPPRDMQFDETRAIRTASRALRPVPGADCRVVGDDIHCSVLADLPPGAEMDVYAPVVYGTKADEVRFRAVVAGNETDPDHTNDEKEADFEVTSDPDSAVKVVSDGAEGTAREDDSPSTAAKPTLAQLGKITRVEVAVLKKQKNKKRCLWLANTRLKFKATKARNGKCDRGRWLKAKGTKKWRFKLARRWPKGTYTLYSRAVNKAGVREAEFSKRDKNVVTFTVRR